MCEYVNIEKGQCKITKSTCPYLYFCNKTKTYKQNRAMPNNCKIKQNIEVPKGYYKVCFERNNKLYINVNEKIIIIQNPYNYTPALVKLIKLKNGNWKIKETK